MPNITLRNIPADLYEKLKQSARASHRSIYSEIIACIERAVRSQPVDPESLVASARVLREKTASCFITDEEFNLATGHGGSADPGPVS